MECLRTIAAAHPGVAPDNIWVTGHSLGGALATLFSAAMIVGGEYGPNGQGNETPAAVRTWPWDRAKVITVSAPKCAGKRFHRNFNGKVYCRRVVLSTDPITKDPPRILSGRNAVKKHDLHHVGSEVYVTQATTVGHALNPVTLGDHEPKAIRRRLIHNLTEWGDLAAPLPAGCAHDPWNEYPNFNGMCGHTIMTDQNLRAIFAGMNAEVVQFLGVFNTTMGQNDAYRTMIRASVAAARTLAVTASIPRIGITTGKAALPARQALGLTASQIRLANPDLGLYLGLLMIIAEFGASAVVSKTMFANEPALLACVQ